MNNDSFIKLQQEVAGYKASFDDFFLVTMGIIIYFMQCGFAFLETGAVRSKNTTNILLKNVLDSFIGCIAYYILGYGLAYGEPGNFFCGLGHFALANLPADKFSFWFFQFVFAATAATIVSGAVAERCEFLAYLVYSTAITGFLYPVVSHWAWGGGWLSTGVSVSYLDSLSNTTVTIASAYQDFAGSGVVHVCGGTAALVAAAFLGPRLDRFDAETKKPNVLQGHSVPLTALGGFILFFGFFAFNGGSQASISSAGDGAAVAISMVNTMLSGSVAGFVVLIYARITGSKWSLLSTINGALAGMVAICAGCNIIQPYSAMITGFLAGLSYLLWSFIVLKVRIDDPLDAVAVHFGGGILGVITVPLLNKERGMIYKWDRQSGLDLAWNVAGLSAIVLWSAIISIIIFGLLKLTKVLRVPAEYEIKGLDIPKHGEPAYPLKAYGHGWTDDADEDEEKTCVHDVEAARRRTVSVVSVDGPMLDNKFRHHEVGMGMVVTMNQDTSQPQGGMRSDHASHTQLNGGFLGADNALQRSNNFCSFNGSQRKRAAPAENPRNLGGHENAAVEGGDGDTTRM